VVLCITADGSKLPPMVILKRNSSKSLQFQRRHYHCK
jgi:hypothetical protein